VTAKVREPTAKYLVRAGYKETEIGRVPEEWEVKPLGQLFAFRNGVNADKSAYCSGIPFVNVLETIKHSHLKCEQITGRVTLPEVTKAAYAVRHGDVLFNRTSETDTELALASTFLGAEDVVFGGFVIRGRPLSNALDPAYCGYALRSNTLRRQIIPLGQGAVRANIGQENLSRVLAPVPSADEQCAIAKALGDMDALLAGLDRLIAKERDLKQAAMQQLLTGQTHLPGFQGEWETATIADVVTTPVSDGPHLTPKFLLTGVPFLSVNNLVNNRLDFESPRFISMEDHVEFSKKCKPRRGDILFGKAASVGMVGLVETDIEFNIWSPLALIRVSGKMSERFAFYALQGASIAQQIKLLTNASSQGNIGMSDIGLLRIPKPKLGEQEAIATLLSDMDAELTALEARRDKTCALKQGMMQELLTGRTRLV
jgi:type I restriction enzyme, S subunit